MDWRGAAGVGRARMLGGKEGSSACPDVSLVLRVLSVIPRSAGHRSSGVLGRPGYPGSVIASQFLFQQVSLSPGPGISKVCSRSGEGNEIF